MLEGVKAFKSRTQIEQELRLRYGLRQEQARNYYVKVLSKSPAIPRNLGEQTAARAALLEGLYGILQDVGKGIQSVQVELDIVDLVATQRRDEEAAAANTQTDITTRMVALQKLKKLPEYDVREKLSLINAKTKLQEQAAQLLARIGELQSTVTEVAWDDAIAVLQSAGLIDDAMVALIRQRQRLGGDADVTA